MLDQFEQRGKSTRENMPKNIPIFNRRWKLANTPTLEWDVPSYTCTNIDRNIDFNLAFCAVP